MTTGSEIKAPIAGIEAAIGSAFQALEQDKGDFLRAANGNFIILHSSDAASPEDLIVKLAQVHPARFFIITLDDSIAQLNAQVATQCHLVAGGVSVCSEVVRIGLARSSLAALPSVIRANRLPGKHSELLVLDKNIKASEIGLILALVDDLIIDSPVRGNVSEIFELSKKLQSTVDVAWLQLAEWRDHLRALFDRMPAQSLLCSLSKITIEAPFKDNSPTPAALLMAGFLIARLGLELNGASSKSISLRSVAGNKVELNFVANNDDFGCGLRSLKFFGKSSDRIECTRNQDSFQGQVEVGSEKFSTANPATNELTESLLFRYYAIGVSLENYPAALDRAVALDKLLRQGNL